MARAVERMQQADLAAAELQLPPIAEETVAEPPPEVDPTAVVTDQQEAAPRAPALRGVSTRCTRRSDDDDDKEYTQVRGSCWEAAGSMSNRQLQRCPEESLDFSRQDTAYTRPGTVGKLNKDKEFWHLSPCMQRAKCWSFFQGLLPSDTDEAENALLTRSAC